MTKKNNLPDTQQIKLWIKKVFADESNSNQIRNAMERLRNQSQVAELQSCLLKYALAEKSASTALDILRAAVRLALTIPDTSFRTIQDCHVLEFLNTKAYPHPIPRPVAKWPRPDQGRWLERSWTVRRDEQKALRLLFKHLYVQDGTPSEEAYIKANRLLFPDAGVKPLPQHVRPRRAPFVPTRREIKEILAAIENHAFEHPRGHVMWSVIVRILAETQTRGPAISLPQIKHVQWDPEANRCWLPPNGGGPNKTNRALLLSPATSAALRAWLDSHPFKDDAEAPLFLKLRAAMQDHPIAVSLDTQTLSGHLHKIGLLAGVSDRLGTRSFRYMGLTEDSANGVKASETAHRIGRRSAFGEARRYVHLTDAAVVDKTRRLTSRNRIHAQVCPTCGTPQEMGQSNCLNRGCPDAGNQTEFNMINKAIDLLELIEDAEESLEHPDS